MRIKSTASLRGETQRAPTSPAIIERQPSIGELLAEEGHLAKADIDDILARQGEDDGTLFGEIAVRSGKVSAEVVDEALARQVKGPTLLAEDGQIDPSVVAAFDLDDPIATKVRGLRAAILQVSAGKGRHSLASCALIGVDCEDDLGMLAANLAVVMTRLGTATLLIDAGFHHPMQDQLFRIPNGTGLVNHLNLTAEDFAAQPTPIDGLSVMPTGPGATRASHVLERHAILDVIEQWPIQASQIIVALPLDSKQESRSFAHMIAGFDCAVLVAKKNQSTIARLRRAIDALDEGHIPIAGTVIL
ncbi:hypothetical protein BH09PSE3_BH09PSE3_03990 [soil metagenome]